MEMWFSDIHTPNIKLNIRVKKQLFSERSDIQQVDVFDSEDLGKFISLDGEVVFSEKDEFIYDEMVAHVPMAVHPHVRNVLVIGGGDGGVAKELCRYPEIERIDVVEEDEMFVYVSRTFFPETAAGLTDKRVNLYIQDGLKFLRGKVGSTTSSSTIPPIPSAPRRGCSPRSSTAAVSRRSTIRASWSISTAAHSMPRTRRSAARCIRRCSAASPSPRSTRRTFPPVLRATGCSALPAKSIIR